MVDDIVFVALVWYGLVIRLRNPFGSWWPLGLRRILRIIAIFKVLPANCAPNCRFQRRAPTNIEWLMAIWDTTLHLTPIKHDGKSPRNRWFFHLFPDKKIRVVSSGDVRCDVGWAGNSCYMLLLARLSEASWSWFDQFCSHIFACRFSVSFSYCNTILAGSILLRLVEFRSFRADFRTFLASILAGQISNFSMKFHGSWVMSDAHYFLFLNQVPSAILRRPTHI